MDATIVIWFAIGAALGCLQALRWVMHPSIAAGCPGRQVFAASAVLSALFCGTLLWALAWWFSWFAIGAAIGFLNGCFLVPLALLVLKPFGGLERMMMVT